MSNEELGLFIFCGYISGGLGVALAYLYNVIFKKK